ncbi:MAG: bacillithiol system redox-active protein YtxJ [Pyrinomonadaceae bacterium]
MPAKVSPLLSSETLDGLFEHSHRAPVLLFKHSSSCGISAHIFEELKAVETEIHVVVVQSQREISNAIERRTGHRHQSPQAFVIRDGKAVYHASHYGIDPAAIVEHLESFE